MKNKIIFANMLLILFFFNYSVFKNEQHIKEGLVVYFELAPVDPRSLIQGDYMTLAYKITNAIAKECQLWEKQGKHIPPQAQALIRIDKIAMGHFVTLHKKGEKLAANEVLLPFKLRKKRVILPLTTSYFFEEGQAKIFGEAKYGVFKYAHEKWILVHLADNNRKILE